jgi:hypothetical protein
LIKLSLHFEGTKVKKGIALILTSYSFLEEILIQKGHASTSAKQEVGRKKKNKIIISSFNFKTKLRDYTLLGKS